MVNEYIKYQDSLTINMISLTINLGGLIIILKFSNQLEVEHLKVWLLIFIL